MADKVKIIFGTFDAAAWEKTGRKEGYLQALKNHGVEDLDTASIYGGSERSLGAWKWGEDFTIHTKAPGFTPGSLKKENVLSGAEKSFRELGVDQVETYFLHSPDPSTPIEETMEAIQELYKAGRFKHFGLSNFLVADVQKIYDYNSSKGYVLPTVFQMNYNAAARHAEDHLIPLLRKFKIAIYAYSPSAGGFLIRTPEEIEIGVGRFRKDAPASDLYHRLYNKPSLVKGLHEWGAIAKDAGISQVALAYRWVRYNSALSPEFGDGVIVGASKVAQLEETLKIIEGGPLSSEIAARIDKFWETIKDEAPIDNFNS